MNKENVSDQLDQIREFLAVNFLFSDEGFSLSDDASLLEEGVIDSTGVMELILFVEETFEVEIAETDIIPDNFDSVTKIQKYIVRKQPV